MRLNQAAQTLGEMRVNQMGLIARRLIGARFLTIDDFLPPVSPDQGARMAALARSASGEINVPILVFGVMPRSGTNFVRDLAAMHRDVEADVGRLYEFPLLHAAEDAAAFGRDFLRYFPRNAEVLEEYDLLAMLAGAWFRTLQEQSPGKRILLKCPHVHNLTLAQYIFPDAKLILCLRDGRDVVDSTLNTFSRYSLTRKTFRQLADEWRLGTEAITTFAEGGENENDNTMVARYEDIVANPQHFVAEMLAHTELPPESYPWHQVDQMPVRGSSRSSAANEARWQPQAKPSDFNPVKRWAAWSDAQKTRFDKLAGRALELAGYER
jgi:hypothetical protein